MDTDLFRAFIAVSNNLSFTRAAEELNTTQPLLSRAIRRLEDIVDEQLFDRTSRQIRLTSSGVALLSEAQDVLDQVSRAVHQARTAGHGAQRTLRLGYLSSVQWQAFNRGIRKFKQKQPGVQFDFRLLSRDDQTAALRAGQLDAGLLDSGVADRRGLSWKVIGRTRLIMAVPSEWGFDRTQPLDISLLRDRPFLLADPAEVPEMHMLQMLFCNRVGIEPIVFKYAHDVSEIRFLVSAGLCAAFVYETSLLTHIDGVDFIPIKNQSEDLTFDFHIAWIPKRSTLIIRDFVNCMVEETYVPEIVRRDALFDIEWRRANLN